MEIKRFLQKLELESPSDLVLPLLWMHPKDCVPCSRETCTRIYCGSTHNRQEMKADYLYINGREDGGNEVHMHSGILFSCKDKWNYEKSMEMGGSEKCYIKWGNLDSPCSLSYVDPSFKCRYMYLCEWACVEETRKGPVGELQNPSNLGVEERILGGEGLKQGWEHGDGR